MADGKIYHMSSTFRELVHELRTEQDMETVVETLEDCLAQVEANKQACSDAAIVSEGAHDDLDAILQKDQAGTPTSQAISCGAGCAHCCRQIVALAACEAEELVQVAQDRGLVLDQAKLQRQAGYNSDDLWGPAAGRRSGLRIPRSRQSVPGLRASTGIVQEVLLNLRTRIVRH